MNEKQGRQHVGSVHGGAGGNNNHPQCSTARPARQLIRAASGQVVGYVASDTFTKRVRGSVHMLRAPRALALDAPTLADLRALRVATVAVTDTETGTVYTAPLAEFDAHGVAFNRGFGPQVALPLGYWSVDGQPPALPRREPDPDAPRQLPLFAEV